MIKFNSAIGTYGESLAKNFLRDRGYVILDENFTCKIGEIDIIARDMNYVCFIEVKSRYSTKFGSPLESITPNKIKKIHRIAQYYILLNKLERNLFRFDALEISFKENSYNINLIKNAF